MFVEVEKIEIMAMDKMAVTFIFVFFILFFSKSFDEFPYIVVHLIQVTKFVVSKLK